MTTDLRPSPEVVEASGRAALYALLATGFATPTRERWETLRWVILPAALALELPPPLETLVREVARAFPPDPADAAPAHLALFPPVASQDAPGYETAYRGDDLFRQVDLLADIAGFYRAHGFAPGGAERERPDHVVIELEFCSLLARKEVFALTQRGPEEVEICRETTTAFLADHLGCWVPAFARRAGAVARHPFYRALGQLAAEWVETDVAAAGAEPAEHADEPLPQPPPDDGECGPCPTPTGGA